jgi:DNA-directed RNA polymerase beta subunit
LARVDASRLRRSFSRLENVLELPNLIDIQRSSFDWLVDTENGGLRETIDDVSPIEDYTGNLAVVFEEIHFDDPVATIAECREKDLTYARPLTVKVAFQNRETGEIREQSVFMGDFPWMTEHGTFIINGTERVVVTQLVRSPGAYVMEPKDREKQVFIANLMPARGSWLELEIDKKGKVFVRIDRKRKLPVSVLLRAMGEVLRESGLAPSWTGSDEDILALFDNSLYVRNTLEADTEVTKSEEGALIELFKKQRPGEPPSVDAAKNLLNQLFFDPKRYDLTRVGRYKLNSRLHLDESLDTRTLTPRDIVELIKELVSLPKDLGIPEDGLYEGEPIKDYAAEAQTYGREPIEERLDEYEHFGNRRLRTVGELIQEAFRIGLYRMERVVRERLTTEDSDTITPQTIINIRPVVAAQKEFFGSSQLSQFMDQINSLSGLTHRRRLSALGAGGLTRERAPIEVRDVHPTHYGRMCPIETPEGPNIGLMGSLSSFAEVSEHGFVTTPYRKVEDGVVSNDIVRLDANQEEELVIAQANAEIDEKTGKLKGPQVTCRSRDGELVLAAPKDVDLMDVSPGQIWSVATTLIPFLEHDDANRALMGSNMMRQAVPLLKTEAPLIGTGMELRAAIDAGDVVVAKNAGEVTFVDSERIVVGDDEYSLHKYRRSNQGTIIHQKPLVDVGDKLQAGDVLADGSSTDKGELALGKNCLVAFMSWEGYNFEDAIILSERLVKDDELTSIHIEEYEIDARTTKLGDEEITRDIPNRSEESLRNLDDRGIVRIGAEGRDRADRRGEADPRDLQGEGARGPRHLAQGPARRGRRRDRRQDLLARQRGRPVPGRQRPGPRLRGEEAQDRRGRQARRPPRQQGRHLEDRPRGGHAAPRGRHSGRRHPQPARRAEPHEHRPDHGDPPRVGRRQRLVRRRLGGLQARQAERRPREHRDPGLRRRRARGRRRGALQVGGGARRPRHQPLGRSQRSRRAPRLRQVHPLQRPHRRAVRGEGDRRLHVHPQAAPPRGRQDPRAQHGPLLARHPAAAGRQGAVRRSALRRDGGLGARGIRCRVHAAGDAHDQVRRHRRAREGVRGDRQGREHRRAVDPRVVQGAAQGDAVPGPRRGCPLRGGWRRRDARRGRRPPACRRGARHRPVGRSRDRRRGRRRVRGEDRGPRGGRTDR